MFPLAERWVERVALISDEAIMAAQRALWSTLRVVAEPGGAAAFAALLSGAYRPAAGERVGVLVCGANTTAGELGEGGALSQPLPYSYSVRRNLCKGYPP